jgi:hypothetical protein
MKKLVLYIALLMISLNLKAEDFQSKGTDFWLTFLPNFHNGQFATDDELRLQDSIYIYIAADSVCSGVISGVTRQGIPFSKNFNISNVNQVYTYKVPAYDYELWGYNMSSYWNKGRNQSEVVSKLAFHITATSNITVYAHSQAITTSDAFIVFPTTVLGNKYLVMSYNSDGFLDANSPNVQSTPSQFAIVSVEDNNEVTIKPKAGTRYNYTYTQKIILNKGEVYLVQANISKDTLRGDLTGTEIESTKNIAVFAGHQRATIPFEARAEAPSRDFLAEQMIPVLNWGRNAFLCPFAHDSSASIKWTDRYRILAAYDGTKVIIGLDTIDLSANEFYEGILDKPLSVVANNKIMVAQFKKTSSDFAHPGAESDPLMLLIPPKEQFLKSCKIINAQAYETSGSTTKKVYNSQYINVVLAKKAKNMFYLDGVLTNSVTFTDIPNSDYSYTIIAVTDGVHDLKCEEPFEVYVYGYGVANSYGYLGGMSFVPIVYDLPQFSLNSKCDSLVGTVDVEKGKDIQLTSVFFQDPVNVTPAANKIDSASTRITVGLIDRRKDGSVVINAKDSKGRSVSKTVEVPGFTLAFNENNINSYEINLNSQVELNIDNNFVFNIKNYGKFNQKIVSIKKKDDARLYKSSFNLNQDIMPDSTFQYKFTFKIDVNEPYDNKIVFYGECGDSLVLNIQFSTSKCGKASFEYGDFLSDAKTYKTGYAYNLNKKIRMTSTNQDVKGAIWRAEKMPVGESFSNEFKFIISNGSNNSCDDNSDAGADGIAFVIQNTSLNSTGITGGGIGYANINNGMAIEFDTFNNDSTQIENFNDPNGNHVAVMVNPGAALSPVHDKTTTLALNQNIIPIQQNVVYFSKVDYDSKASKLEVYLDTNGTFSSPVLVVNDFDISKYVKLDNNGAYIGFTSATGCASEYHDILSWSFCGSKSITSVSLEDNSENSGFNIRYIDGSLKVCCFENNSIDEVKIYDLNGNMILNQTKFEVIGSELNIPLLILTNGSYLAEIKSGNQVIRKVFIKY